MNTLFYESIGITNYIFIFKEIELELIDTLRTVTEGKIYVEVERARLTHRLSMMKEAEGKIEEAKLRTIFEGET